MEQVAQLFNNAEQGQAKLKKYTISPEEASWANLRLVRDGGWLYAVGPGEYIKLIINGQLYMSDTQMERRTNYEFMQEARGDVMIAGLGIGLIIYNLIPKIKDGTVKSITVYEKFQDVIDLVEPTIRQQLPDGFDFKVILGDILTYEPPKTEKYDTIYFDIWPEISSDNHKDMVLLHNRWKSRKRKGGWMDSWMKKKVYQLAKAEREYEGYGHMLGGHGANW